MENRDIANKIVGDTWRSKEPLTGKTITDLITEALNSKDRKIEKMREALLRYADSSNWFDNIFLHPYKKNSRDGFEIAKEALADGEK